MQLSVTMQVNMHAHMREPFVGMGFTFVFGIIQLGRTESDNAEVLELEGILFVNVFLEQRLAIHKRGPIRVLTNNRDAVGPATQMYSP